MPVEESNTLRSEGLRDFISHRPGFLIRWGIPIFFCILAFLIIGCYFIQYPDIVHASAKINSINAPKQVVTKSGGKLTKLFKGDNGTVLEGEVIGYMESIASHKEVIQLASFLDTLRYLADSNKLEEIPRFWQSTKQTFAHLGELQSAHKSFMQGFLNFKDYLSDGFYVTKKRMLGQDIGNAQKMLQILYQQKELQQQDMAITQQNYDVHDTLHRELLINDFEYRSQKSQLINKRMSIPQINASIINNKTQQNGLQKELLELDNQISRQRTEFVQLLNSYISTVNDWKQKYLLIAPVSGTLVYSGFLEENQQLQSEQVIGYVTGGNSKYYVEMMIPQANFGKVKPGQEVLLKFPSYPAQEFGSVMGRIEYVKNIPSDSGYLSKVTLPDGLITSYKKTILFRDGLTATAEIITEKRRLSDRFLGQLGELIQ